MRSFNKLANLHRLFFKRAGAFGGDKIDEAIAVQKGLAHPGPPSGPDEDELAYQSRLQEKSNNYNFANPLGGRSGIGNRINLHKALLPGGPDNPIPPSRIGQPHTLPTHLRQPPFIMPASPTDGLQ